MSDGGGATDVGDLAADVVVVGAGAAGLAAAIEAVRRGASVLVLEKQPAGTAGGNTVVSGGVWFHHEDVDAAARYLRSLCAPLRPDPDVVDTWAKETARTSDWMRALGADVRKLAFHEEPEYPELDGSECYQGYWGVDGVLGDGRLHRFLTERAVALGVDLRLGCAATGLRATDGAVTGVMAAGLGVVEARGGVVLASGGFAGHAGRLAQHLGLPDARPWGSPHCTGDALDLVAPLGADTTGLGNHMRLLGTHVPGQAVGLPVHVPPGCGYAFVDDEGRRFVDESLRNRHGHVRVGQDVERFAAGPFWLVVDARALETGPLSAPAPFGWSSRMGGYRWSDDNRREIELGFVRTAGSWRDLAAQLAVDPNVLDATMTAYDEASRRGQDPFGRPAATMAPLDRAPVAALRCAPLVAFTGGGPRRDGQARVLAADGRPIDGLHAAGEASSTYLRCIDGGMMIADALAFGRVAGATAAGRVSS